MEGTGAAEEELVQLALDESRADQPAASAEPPQPQIQTQKSATIALKDVEIEEVERETMERLKFERNVEFFTGLQMFPILRAALEQCRNEFKTFQYNFDHMVLCALLQRKISEGVRCRMILDRKNFYNSNCARQCSFQYELMQSGAEVRLNSGNGRGFACQHAKTIIMDDKIFFTGSANMTENSFTNSKEHLLAVVEPIAVGKMVADFDSTWELSDQVTVEDALRVRDRRQELKDKAAQERDDKKLAKQKSKSLVRSLSLDFQENETPAIEDALPRTKSADLATASSKKRQPKKSARDTTAAM